MKEYEDELQRNIEAGKDPETGAIDARAYNEVFRVLKKDPGFSLPADFSDRVVTRIISEKSKASLAKDYFWFGAGVFFLLIALLGTMLFTGMRIDFGFLKGMAEYKGLVIFGSLFITFLHWLDKRLLKTQQNRQHF